MKILSRYVLKEHLGPLTFSLTALTSLLLLNYIAKRFGELVGKGLPWTAIAEFFLLSIPFTVALTLPMAVLVATLHAFSRLAAENEVTALKASGVSLRRLMFPVLVAAAGVTVFMMIFNDQILPRSNHQLAVLQTDIAQKKPTFALREQVINEVSPGKLFLRANHLDEGSNRMREVTIYDLSEPTRRRTIYADSGNIALARNQSDLLMTLYHGTMQDVPVAAPAQLQRLFFSTDFITVKGVANQFQQSQAGQSKGNREMSVCEMQREVAKARNTYLGARRDLLQGMRTAREGGIKLDPALAKLDTHVPSTFTLGGVYCSLTRALGVPELHAQSTQTGQNSRTTQATQQPKPMPPRPTPVPPVRGTITSGTPPTPTRPAQGSSANSSRPASQPAAGTPAAALPGTLRGTTAVAQTPARAPSSGVSVSPTPSSIAMAQVRLGESRTTIDSYEIEIHKKFALAVACFVFVLLGAPIALRFPRGGVGLTIGVSLFVFALYYIGLTAGAAAASNGLLPPAVAMWAANVIFTIAALVLLSKMGNEGSTARGGDVQEMLENARRWLSARLHAARILPERRANA